MFLIVAFMTVLRS